MDADEPAELRSSRYQYREVRREGDREAYERDGIHFSSKVSANVRRRLAGMAVAFHGGHWQGRRRY